MIWLYELLFPVLWIGFLLLAQMRAIVAFILISLVLWYKLRMEEQWMRTQFGAPYEAYSRRTSALVPFVL